MSDRDRPAEEWLVGAMLHGRPCAPAARLHAIDFTGDCGAIFAAILAAQAAGLDVHPDTIMPYLGHRDCQLRLAALMDGADEVFSIFAADCVERIERARHRRVLRLAADALAQLARDLDPVPFDRAFASLVDAGLPGVLGAMTAVHVRVRRPVVARDGL